MGEIRELGDWEIGILVPGRQVQQAADGIWRSLWSKLWATLRRETKKGRACLAPYVIQERLKGGRVCLREKHERMVTAFLEDVRSRPGVPRF